MFIPGQPTIADPATDSLIQTSASYSRKKLQIACAYLGKASLELISFHFHHFHYEMNFPNESFVGSCWE